MSRSNQTDLINPANRFIDWSGSEGKAQYFDKSLGEKGENVEIELPFKFLILDKVSQVTGGIDDNNGYVGFWSNAIRNTKTQQLTVRSKRGVEVQGYYEAIKGYPGVKFMTGLYVAYKGDEGLEIGYLKLKGAALTAWIEFSKAHKNIYDGAFSITGNAKKKKGTNTYYEPVFAFHSDVSEKTDEEAKELDVHLQEYLTAYFAQAGLAEVEREYSGQAKAATVGGEFYDNEPEMPEHGDTWRTPEGDEPF